MQPALLLRAQPELGVLVALQSEEGGPQLAHRGAARARGDQRAAATRRTQAAVWGEQRAEALRGPQQLSSGYSLRTLRRALARVHSLSEPCSRQTTTAAFWPCNCALQLPSFPASRSAVSRLGTGARRCGATQLHVMHGDLDSGGGV